MKETDGEEEEGATEEVDRQPTVGEGVRGRLLGGQSRIGKTREGSGSLYVPQTGITFTAITTLCPLNAPVPPHVRILLSPERMYEVRSTKPSPGWMVSPSFLLPLRLHPLLSLPEGWKRGRGRRRGSIVQGLCLRPL